MDACVDAFVDGWTGGKMDTQAHTHLHAYANTHTHAA